tara:strand:- start:357 stop:503 length:147 start_codon:yes stop_codon:yes gene_type:complete
MKTKIQRTVTNQFRVLWKEGDFRGGYNDFNTNEQAINYIKELKNEKQI